MVSKRIGAAAIGVLLSILVLEVALRHIDALPIQRNPLRGFHAMHPRLGWTGVKGYAARFRRPDFDVVIRHDASGFRLPSESGAQLEHAPRLAFIGDSFTWGWGVGQGDVWTDRMQALLGTRAMVRNFGVNAYGTGQQLLLLDDVLAAEPEIVTVLCFHNDLAENEAPSGGTRPWYRMAGDELLLENCPVDRDLSDWSRKLMRNSVALSTLRYNSNILGERLRSSYRATRASDEEPPQVPAADIARRWKLQRALLTALKERCDAARTELRVAYIPAKQDVTGNAPSPALQTGGADVASRLAEICGTLAIPFLDLTEGIRVAWSTAPEHGPEGEPFYFPIDQHWSPLGHELAARLLFEGWTWP